MLVRSLVDQCDCQVEERLFVTSFHILDIVRNLLISVVSQLFASSAVSTHEGDKNRHHRVVHNIGKIPSRQLSNAITNDRNSVQRGRLVVMWEKTFVILLEEHGNSCW